MREIFFSRRTVLVDDNVNVRRARTRRKYYTNHIERVRVVEIRRNREVYLTERALEVVIVRCGAQKHVLVGRKRPSEDRKSLSIHAIPRGRLSHHYLVARRVPSYDYVRIRVEPSCLVVNTS